MSASAIALPVYSHVQRRVRMRERAEAESSQCPLAGLRVVGTLEEGERDALEAMELTAPFERSFKGRAEKFLLVALAVNEGTGRTLTDELLKHQTLLKAEEICRATTALLDKRLIRLEGGGVRIALPPLASSLEQASAAGRG